MSTKQEPKEKRNELLAAKIIKNLQHRHFDAYFCKTSEDAKKKVLEIMSAGSSVTWGGSMTIRDIGLPKLLKQQGYNVIDRDEVNTEEEKRIAYLKAFDCDFYLSSVNAISEDGVIVNIDGNGNRIAAITWGPKKVIFIVGMNKITQNVETALSRARSIAAPINCMRFDVKTPCHTDGVCHQCNSPESICNYIHFLRNSHPVKRHTVILVDEILGY